MGIFEDFSNFLEARLEEFLDKNPQLKLEVLSDELKKQERDTIKLILNLQAEQKKLEAEIVNLGKEIQKWHPRIEKARASGRLDLAQEAENREINLLRLGKLLWGQMETAKSKIKESQELLDSIKIKQQELEIKIQQIKKNNYSSYNKSFNNVNTNYGYSGDGLDPLEDKFQQWEIDQELKKMKND